MKMLVMERRLVGQGKENVGFDMCLIILVSLVSRSVPQSLRMNVCFSLQIKTIVLEDLKPLNLIIKREPETNLDTKFLKVGHMSRPTNLHFETGVFKCVVSPLALPFFGLSPPTTFLIYLLPIISTKIRTQRDGVNQPLRFYGKNL